MGLSLTLASTGYDAKQASTSAKRGTHAWIEIGVKEVELVTGEMVPAPIGCAGIRIRAANRPVIGTAVSKETNSGGATR